MRRLSMVIATILATGLPAAAAPLDPFAQAVVDSLAFPERSSPADLLDAVAKATRVEAFEVAKAYLRKLEAALEAAGERRPEVLADLGERFDDGTLLALKRRLSPTAANVTPLVHDIQTASRLRRRDPSRLARAVADLSSDSYATRSEAARRLAAAGDDALGPLVTWLSSPAAADGDAPAAVRARVIAKDLIESLGDEGVQVLVARLGGDDFDSWPGLITAIDMADPVPARVSRFLLAAALVDGVPAEARRRSTKLLERLLGRVPSKPEAIAMLAADVDALLCADPPAAIPATGDTPETDEAFVWDAASRSVVRRPLTDRLRRAVEAIHLSRDLEGLGPSDGRTIRLILLARLEMAVLVAEATADASPQQRFSVALTGPEGLSIPSIAEVLDDAVHRGMSGAAAAAASVIADAPLTAGDAALPSVRRSLVRTLGAPDLGVRFAAARALVLKGPRSLYAGKSHVVETLLACATSTGAIRAVIAHPNRLVGQEIAADVAVLGYTPTVVTRGRDAVVSARANADTRLVVVARRLGPPGAHETAEFLSWIPSDETIEVVFASDVLEEGSVRAVSDADRSRAAARLARAEESLRLLAVLDDHQEDVSASLPIALAAAAEPALASRAIDLLSRLGHQDAQAALHGMVVRPNASDDLRDRALAAFRASVGRFGILLESGEILAEYRRYNSSTDPAVRRWIGSILDTLEAPPTMARPPSADASQPQ